MLFSVILNRYSLFALLLVGIIGACLYLPMVSDKIGWYNSSEFTIAAMTLDVPHAPGYPLFTRLGNLAIELLSGSSASYKVNLLTAFIGIGGAMLLTLLLLVYGLTACSSALGGILLLTGATYWEQSLLAEVYNLEICLIIAGLFAGIAIEKGFSGGLAGFFAGVAGAAGVGHRPTFILYALSLVLFFRSAQGRFKPGLRFWIFLVLGVVVGLLPTFDLYLRLQNPQRVLLDPLIGQGIDGFLQVFTATVYSGGFFVFSASEVLARLVYFFKFVVKDGGSWLLIGPAVLLLLGRRPGCTAVPECGALPQALMVILLTNLAFVLNYNAFEAQTMLLPALMALAAFTAMAVNRVIPNTIRILCCLALASTAIYAGGLNVAAPDASPVNFVKQALAAVPRGSAMLMSNDIEFRPYWFLRISEAFRQDISVQLLDRIENTELQALKPLVDAGRLYGTLVYPADSRARLVASYSILADGYLHKIVPAASFFADSEENLSFPDSPIVTLAMGSIKFVECAQNSEKSGASVNVESAKNLEILKSLEKSESSEGKVKPGDFLSYSYQFSGSPDAFKKLAVAAFLIDDKDLAIQRHGIMVGHDIHFPSEFFCQNGKFKYNDLTVKRSLVIPTDLEPGNYRVMMVVAMTSGNLPAEWLEFLPADVNLFNLDGFLEVFTLKYGLACRPLVKALTIKDLSEEPTVKPLWLEPFQLASFTIQQ